MRPVIFLPAFVKQKRDLEGNSKGKQVLSPEQVLDTEHSANRMR